MSLNLNLKLIGGKMPGGNLNWRENDWWDFVWRENELAGNDWQEFDWQEIAWRDFEMAGK